jgi:hypothetical protein
LLGQVGLQNSQLGLLLGNQVLTPGPPELGDRLLSLLGLLGNDGQDIILVQDDPLAAGIELSLGLFDGGDDGADGSLARFVLLAHRVF